ncbi:hypothetical protein B0181_03560 [Moraxella caviae]|uniref:Uncharacterized protein n=1 Tax=Moraxella caviae TaxID=34060 RepID=A0A1T0A6A1_9GAMM|nr:hypothetical protein B0181_03560 [Moraxella caviae]
MCEIAHSTLAQAKAVRTLPSVHSLDIAEIHTPELAELMIDTLGRSIPVLLTANALLCYPFGVMDILAQN